MANLSQEKRQRLRAFLSKNIHHRIKVHISGVLINLIVICHIYLPNLFPRDRYSYLSTYRCVCPIFKYTVLAALFFRL